MKNIQIGHFRVTLCLCFKTSHRAKTFHVKISLICMKMNLERNTSSYEWFRTKPRFDTEAKCKSVVSNRQRSILYKYSNMVPRLSGQYLLFGVVFSASKSLVGIEKQKKLKTFTILAQKPRSHVRILINRT